MLNETYLILKPIPGFSMYKARSDGEIINSRTKEIKSKCMRKDRSYYQISLHNDFGEQKTVFVHKLMALAFFGVRNKTWEINHKDGKKKYYNGIENIEYVKHVDNMKHAAENNLMQHGTQRPGNKLSEDDVIYIFKSNMINTHLAGIFGVHKQTISNIKKGKKWGWLTKNIKR